jgi:AraC-like DNA-binding protein
MNEHYRYNIELSRFAFLTGRSLSTFKRDFEKIFNLTPNKWLVRKRLDEAYYLIKERQKKPTEIYLGLGFEDISHFSFAFKKAFGITPNQL